MWILNIYSSGKKRNVNILVIHAQQSRGESKQVKPISEHRSAWKQRPSMGNEWLLGLSGPLRRHVLHIPTEGIIALCTKDSASQPKSTGASSREHDSNRPKCFALGMKQSARSPPQKEQTLRPALATYLQSLCRGSWVGEHRTPSVIQGSLDPLREGI